MGNFVNILSALGAIFLAIAFAFNVIQFRRLEKSIRGSTYQQLTGFAIELKKLLLEIQTLNTFTQKKHLPTNEINLFLNGWLAITLTMPGIRKNMVYWMRNYGIVMMN